jgi:serine/threonine-protein kinase RsbT
MIPTTTEVLQIRSSDDIVRVRQYVRQRSVEIGLGLVDQTKLITAASELARNTLDYGLGGIMSVTEIHKDGRRGLRLEFADEGPGIENLDLALTDGYTTGKGLGLGLTGARRLSNEFSIDTAPGKGTRVTIARWK